MLSAASGEIRVLLVWDCLFWVGLPYVPRFWLILIPFRPKYSWKYVDLILFLLYRYLECSTSRSSSLSKSSLFWDPLTVTRWPWGTSALSRFFARMCRNCDQAIVWNTLKGLKPIVCTPTVTIAVSEAFQKTLVFCITLSFYFKTTNIQYNKLYQLQYCICEYFAC